MGFVRPDKKLCLGGSCALLDPDALGAFLTWRATMVSATSLKNQEGRTNHSKQRRSSQDHAEVLPKRSTPEEVAQPIDPENNLDHHAPESR